MRFATVSIHQANLSHNLNQIKSRTTARVLAMVKANAYGHSVERAVPALLGADGFGVACMSEALDVQAVLDGLGVVKPVVLMEGVFSQTEWQQAIERDFAVVIHHQQQLDWACQTLPNDDSATRQIWLKYNTAMNRLGFDKDSVIKACDVLMDKGYRVILTSHFACADDKDNPTNAKQIDAFDECYQLLKAKFGEKIQGSLCNSAGIVNFPKSHYDWVRTGIALYGSSPVADVSRDELGLRAGMSLTAKIMAIHQLNVGEQVGYGGLWTAHQPSVIGIVSIGYGDGYPRVIHGGQALVMGDKPTLCPIVGRVAMDMLAVDLTLCSVGVGASVILWGDGLSIDDVAKQAGTIGYELMCRLTARPDRECV